MEQYISKNSLTVEIEKLKKRFMTDQDDEFSDGYHYALKLLSSFLDNFEMKEINLDKEYIRKNTFIEKTCEWLEQTLEPYIPYCNINIDLSIEKFKKYMRGE